MYMRVNMYIHINIKFYRYKTTVARIYYDASNIILKEYYKYTLAKILG